MKNIKFIMLATALFAFGLSVSSCGSKSNSKDAMENVDMSGPEYTSAYVCPMHCEGSGSDAEGKCSVCGMDYVANETHEADGHDHDSHDDHNH